VICKVIPRFRLSETPMVIHSRKDKECITMLKHFLNSLLILSQKIAVQLFYVYV
jgi:hypothetical protein